MRLTLATRIFLGYAAVLVTFGAVSIFSVAEMHRTQVEIRLVSEGYLHLSQTVAAIETFHKNLASDIHQNLSGDADDPKPADPKNRRFALELARHYYPGLMAATIAEGRTKARQMAQYAPASEVPFLTETQSRFDELEKRYAEYGQAAEAVFSGTSAEAGESAWVPLRLDRLKQLESAIGLSISLLHRGVETRITELVEHTNVRERRTGVAIIGLSVLAIAVGLIATLFSARTLRPVRTLIEGVSRIGRGDYEAQLGVRGDDEISLLAREFNQMAKSLREREAQLKEKQEALLRAEQLAAVGRISAQIAHEVRNPLSSIGLNVEMLQEGLERAQFTSPAEGREAKDLLASITREVDRLTEVTEEYLKMARVPAPALSPEDVNAVLESVLTFSREELERAKVSVVRRLDPQAPRAFADEGQLRQVFLNLLRNSREAMGDGGTLTVDTRTANGEVEVRIADSGRGLSAAAQKRLFEPFFSTKEGGTGLGLAVSRQILQSHGGSIDCESSEGAGATFVIRLRRA